MRQRADAEENRNALLEAARDVFAEHGVDAPMDLVRVRARVGRATMYRHFPDRRDLHLAIVDDLLARLEACRPNGTHGTVDLGDLLALAANEAAHSPALHGVWDKVRLDPAAAPLVDRLKAVLEGPLQRAHNTGRATAWLCVEDMFLAIRMLGAASRGLSQDTRQAEAQRALSILIEGLGIATPAPKEFQNAPH